MPGRADKISQKGGETMEKDFFDLQLFTDGGGAGAGGGTGAATGGAAGGGNGSGSQANSGGAPGGATYSYKQAEQLATARAENASRNALAKYFESQGMTQEEIASAIADFKAKKSSQHPEVSKAEQERDEALAKVAEMENLNYLRDRGVRADDLDYVLFKASRRVDDKTDFKKAADAFLKENPRFTGKGYRVVSTSAPDGGSGRSQTVNDSINAAIRSAFGR